MFAVLTTDDNVAAGRQTRQSSVYKGSTADRANDGNINGHLGNGETCMHTTVDLDYPWWAVDLGSERFVRSVTIYNRVDGNYVHIINETLKSSQDQAKIVWQHQ